MPPDAGCNAARLAGEEITKETSPGRFTKRPGLVLDTGGDGTELFERNRHVASAHGGSQPRRVVDAAYACIAV